MLNPANARLRLSLLGSIDDLGSPTLATTFF